MMDRWIGCKLRTFVDRKGDIRACGYRTIVDWSYNWCIWNINLFVVVRCIMQVFVQFHGDSCYYCFKIIMIFYYREIHYNVHPDTPMPNIYCFLDAIISIRIKSIASIFLSIFPILFLSQFYIRPPPFPSSIFAPVVHGPLVPAYLWAELSVKAQERLVGEQRGAYDEGFDAHIASLSCNFFFFSHCLSPKTMYM